MAGKTALREPGRDTATGPPDSNAATQQGLFHAVARHRQFRFLWAAGIITQLGQWFQSVALGWLALTLTDSPGFVGKIGFASGVPILLISFPAGALSIASIAAVPCWPASSRARRWRWSSPCQLARLDRAVAPDRRGSPQRARCWRSPSRPRRRLSPRSSRAKICRTPSPSVRRAIAPPGSSAPRSPGR